MMSKTFKLWGRVFAVLAEFPNTDAGCKEANDYMLANDGACLLDAQGPTLILAHRDDKGKPAQDAA